MACLGTVSIDSSLDHKENTIKPLLVYWFTAVRYGRVPKRSREKSTEETSRVTTTDADQSDTETKQLAVYDIILTVSQAHHANCGYTEEHTRNLVRKPLVFPQVRTRFKKIFLFNRIMFFMQAVSIYFSVRVTELIAL